jgi:hypothetical protein
MSRSKDEDEVEEHRDDVDDPATVQFGEGCEEEGTEPETVGELVMNLVIVRLRFPSPGFACPVRRELTPSG